VGPLISQFPILVLLFLRLKRPLIRFFYILFSFSVPLFSTSSSVVKGNFGVFLFLVSSFVVLLTYGDLSRRFLHPALSDNI
ncbi:hypothetical protein LINGRAHAP2_LOCUS14764, partial [Linum grandiflorum]